MISANCSQETASRDLFSMMSLLRHSASQREIAISFGRGATVNDWSAGWEWPAQAL
jgi:hypothetical protein